MADYRELLGGTLKNIVEKVKDVAETTGMSEVYAKGIERTKSYGSMAKLTLSINSDTEELKRIYQEIGRLYYDENKASPEGFFAPLFAQVDALNESISEKRRDIDAIKAELDSAAKGDIDVEIGEFEDVVNSTESDGTGKEE